MSTGIPTILIMLVVLGMASSGIFLFLLDVADTYDADTGSLVSMADEAETVSLLDNMTQSFEESGAEMDDNAQSDISVFKSGLQVAKLMRHSISMSSNAVTNLAGLMLTPGFIIAGVLAIISIIIFFFIFRIFFPGAIG